MLEPALADLEDEYPELSVFQRGSRCDWTKLTSKDCDIPAFIQKMEAMKQGKTSICPFCGGTVSLLHDDNGTSIFACGSCDMRIETTLQ